MISEPDLLLTLQIALLGNVVPRLRAVTVGCRVKNQIVLRFYYDGFVTLDDRESVSCIETEILARFWDEDDPIAVDWMAIRQDSPELIDWTDMLIYHRYEENFQLLREPFPYRKLDSQRPDQSEACIVMLRALIGAVTPELRRVYIVSKMGKVQLFFYYQGIVSPLSSELASKVASLVARNVDDGTHPELVKWHVERLDFPDVPAINRWCVYSKEEPFGDTRQRALNEMMKVDRELLLEIQIALLGRVNTTLRAVSVSCRVENRIVLRFYYDGSVSDDEQKTVSFVKEYLIAQFWRDAYPIDVVDGTAERWDCPKSIDWTGMLVYHRYEESFYLSHEPFPCPQLDSHHLDEWELRLVVLRALIGAIPPELRDVYVQFQLNEVQIFFYYHGPFSDLTHQLASKVVSFVAQHIDDGTYPELVKWHVNRLDFPESPPTKGILLYSIEHC